MTPTQVSNGSRPTKKLLNIQALRGVAILLVLLRHAAHYEQRYGGRRLPFSDFLTWGNCGVDLFFAISGFVMVAVTAGKFHAPAASREFLWKRATRIYPLYWLYTLLVLPLFLWRPEMVNSAHTGESVNVLGAFLLFPQAAPPLVGQGWSLIHEMFFYLVFATCLLAPARHLVALLLAWTAATVGGHLLAGPSSGPVASLITHPLTLEFIGGCVAGLLALRPGARFGRIAFAAGALLLLAGSASRSPGEWQRVLFWGVPCMLMVYGAAASEPTGFRLPRFLAFIGDISYSLYLSHILVIVPVALVFWHIARPGVAANLAGFAGMLLAAIAAGAISYRMFEQPLLRITSGNAHGQRKPARRPPASLYALATHTVAEAHH